MYLQLSAGVICLYNEENDNFLEDNYCNYIGISVLSTRKSCTIITTQTL